VEEFLVIRVVDDAGRKIYNRKEVMMLG